MIMTALHTRKQLLVAESALNRADLEFQIACLREELKTLRHQVRMAGTVATKAGLAMAAWTAVRRAASPARKEKGPGPLGRTLLRGAQVALSLLMSVLSRPGPTQED